MRTDETWEQFRARQREYEREWRAKNPEKVAAKRAAYLARNPDAERKRVRDPDKMRVWRATAAERQRSRSHGLTRGEVAAALAAQGGRCAICGDSERVKIWHGDHDHVTGAFRAVLCHHCNVGLGMFRDDLNRLQAAARYLSLHSLF